MLNSCAIFMFIPIFVIFYSSLIMPFYVDLKKDIGVHQILIIAEISIEYFYGIILPLFYMWKKNDVRKYLWSEFKLKFLCENV